MNIKFNIKWLIENNNIITFKRYFSASRVYRADNASEVLARIDALLNKQKDLIKETKNMVESHQLEEFNKIIEKEYTKFEKLI
jgi:hypothetical protein